MQRALYRVLASRARCLAVSLHQSGASLWCVRRNGEHLRDGWRPVGHRSASQQRKIYRCADLGTAVANWSV